MADPISAMLFKTLLSVGQAYAANAANTPAYRPEPATMQRSLGDAAEAILKCYHRTGQFRGVQVMETPWSGARVYQARRSAVLRIDWQGAYLGNGYSTFVVLMERDNAIKTHVVSDSAVIPRNSNCALEQWTPAN